MAALNSGFDILRGWPNSSAVQEDFIIGGTTNHAHKTGTWVSLDSSKKDGTMTTSDLAANSGFGSDCYLIIEGRDDYSSRFANRVTCLLGGGYIVRIPKEGKDAEGAPYTCLNSEAGTFAPGDLVKVVGSALTKVTVTALADGLDEQNPPQPNLAEVQANIAIRVEREKVVGKVLAVDSTNNTIDILVF